MKAGVNIGTIYESIQHLQNAPHSTATFYKKYGHVMKEERANLQEYLGNKALARIEEDSDRILELALKSKGGWNPSETIELKDSDNPDEQRSAVKTLMRHLGKEVDEE